MYIFDLDGTLALNDHRQHLVTEGLHRWDEFESQCGNDMPNDPVIQVFVALYKNMEKLEIWSGRKDRWKSQTESWLVKYVLSHCVSSYSSAGIVVSHMINLRMRPTSDNSPDQELKERWLYETMTAGLEIDAVFDDRERVVNMWRSHGITCFQVAPGRF